MSGKQQQQFVPNGYNALPQWQEIGANDQLSVEIVREAAEYVRARFPSDFAPAAAVVCGSGLSSIAESLTDCVRIAFADIPHFPKSTVESHEGTSRAA